MEVWFKKSFIKDFKDLPKGKQEKVRGLCTETFPEISSFSDLKKYTPEKLRGFDNCYKIRVGNYRLGLIKKENKVVFARVLHRKDIYRRFP